MLYNLNIYSERRADLTTKSLKKQKLRNNEYYNMQDIFDELYDKSAKGKNFTNLMDIISSEQNILLAYRNIKKNKGSTTKGTDGRDITYYTNMPKDIFVKHIKNMLNNYHPKSVRRVEIPKPNGKTRPLGIPCMGDRIIQQCLKQVLEPICEAKFHKHNYGFRPNRSAHHAVSRSMSLININKLHYVVDIDIKSFFDNVNHGKLIKQIWTIGIHDKKLIAIISKILKSEIEGIGKPNKGTPQGGILSPLLSNIVLNELDWWISSQWETFETKHDYTTIRKNGYVDLSNKYGTMKKTNLKEIWFVRYADDFKIFCRDFETANKIYISTKTWLNKRLYLEISDEKSKITNLKTNYTEFLGFRLKAKPKKNKYVCQSRMSKKSADNVTSKLKKHVRQMKNSYKPTQVNRLNAMIIGIHNYYRIATNITVDLKRINYLISTVLHNRLKKVITNEPKPSKSYNRLYGNYKGKVITVNHITIFPINGIKTCPPMNFTQEICNYTNIGRELVHKKLSNNYYKHIRYLLNNGGISDSTELRDNKISLMIAQKGICNVTGKELDIGNMECHHKKPRKLGGKDNYNNLVWIHKEVHKLIHATQDATIRKYLQILNLDNKSLEKLNKLRIMVGNSVI